MCNIGWHNLLHTAWGINKWISHLKQRPYDLTQMEKKELKSEVSKNEGVCEKIDDYWWATNLQKCVRSFIKSPKNFLFVCMSFCHGKDRLIF